MRYLFAKLRERAPALHGPADNPLPDPSAVRDRVGGDVVELAGLADAAPSEADKRDD
jgi:hypothetical protein